MKFNKKQSGSIVLFLLLFGSTVNSLFANEKSSSAPIAKKEKFIADEVIAVVGSSMILYSDLKMAEDMVKQSYIERGYTGESALAEALESLLRQNLLASYAAKDSLSINEAQVFMEADNYINSLIESRGSSAEVEKFFNRPIFSVREYIMKRLREGQMAQAMQRQVQSEVILTPKDIVKYYKNVDKDSLMIIPEQYVYSQVTQQTPRTDAAKLDVKEELLSIRERILNGSNFRTMARLYSEDPGSAGKGGDLEPSPAEAYDPAFAEELKRLKVNQVSQVIESRYGFHIIQLISKTDEGLYHARHILMRVKFKAEDLEKAYNLLDSVSQKVRADSLSFALAVEQFSDDEDSRKSGGMVTNIKAEMTMGVRNKSTKFFTEDLGAEYQNIKNLKEGEVSKAYIGLDDEGSNIVKFIRLDEIIPSHVANLKDDYVLLEDLALRDKKQQHFEKWLNEKIAEIYIKIDDRYKDIPLKNKGWIK